MKQNGKKGTLLVISFIRHGETDSNKAVPRLLSGQANTELNEQGNKESIALGDSLRKQPIDMIYTSDLKKCLKTTSEITKHHPNVKVQTSKNLREQDVGNFEGLAWDTCKKILKRGDRLFEEHLAENGESTPAFRERIVKQYTDIVRDHLIEPHDEITKFNLAGLQTQLDDSADSSASGSDVGTPNGARKAKLKRFHVVIVTHGGWIKEFIKFVREELNYEIACGENKGFPRCTAIYRLEISKIDKPMFENGLDHLWIGKIVAMNHSPHLASLDKKVEGRPVNISRDASAQSLDEVTARPNKSIFFVAKDTPAQPI
jgi:hypothetical protein